MTGLDLMIQLLGGVGLFWSMLALWKLRPDQPKKILVDPLAGWERWKVDETVTLVWDPKLEREVLGTWREDLMKDEKPESIGWAQIDHLYRQQKIEMARSMDHYREAVAAIYRSRPAQKQPSNARGVLEYRLKELLRSTTQSDAEGEEIVEIKKRLRHLAQDPALEGRLDAQMILDQHITRLEPNLYDEAFEIEQEDRVHRLHPQMDTFCE